MLTQSFRVAFNTWSSYYNLYKCSCYQVYDIVVSTLPVMFEGFIYIFSYNKDIQILN